MMKALARHETHLVRVIPIILRPTDWTDTPFAKLKALPTDGKAVTLWRTNDEAFLDVVKGIKRAIRDLQNGTTYPQNIVASVSLKQSNNQSIPSVTQPVPTNIVHNQIGSITGNNHSIIQAENQYTTNNYYSSPDVQKRDRRDKI